VSTPEARLRDRIGGGRAVALIDGNKDEVGFGSKLSRSRQASVGKG
jgi:hypothetical protein